MDNKQKIKLYKSIYYTIFIVCIAVTAMSLYLLSNYIKVNDNAILILTLVILQTITLLLVIIDLMLTKKSKNKYFLGKCYYVLMLAIAVTVLVVISLNYFSKIFLDSEIILVGLFMISQSFMAILAFIIGIKIGKLKNNTTVTINSISETPNFNDEIALKKKIDELNRKLEIKKLQEEIDRKTNELDKKSEE